MGINESAGEAMEHYEKQSFMLFSKSKCHKNARYRLYFVYLPTMFTDEPRIHRLITHSPKVWKALKIGGVYDVTYNRITLKTYSRTDTFPLTDGEYEGLVDLRDYLFPDEDVWEELGTDDSMPFAYRYYTLSEQKKILSYKPPRGEAVLTVVVNYAAGALSVLIPAALYVLFVYIYAGSLDFVSEGTSPFMALPLVLVLSLPFMIFLMNALYTLSGNLLYHISFTKWTLTRKQILKYGGLKVSHTISKRERNRLIRFGALSFLVFIGVLIFAGLAF